MKIFYHNDADGHCAGFLVYMYAKVASGDQTGYELICINYNDDFPMDKIKAGEQVWIVDYSISPEEMRELLLITDRVTWIDHHASAIEKYGDYGKDIPGVRYDGIAGCELTWAYLKHMTDDGGLSGDHMEFYPILREDAPRFVRLIGDRDVWKFAFGEDSKYLQEAFQMAGKPEPDSSWWIDLMNGCLDEELEIGKTCRDYSTMLKKNTLKGWGHEVIFMGYRVPAVNCTIRTSELFGDLLKKVPFGIIYTHDGKKWVIGLYSDNDTGVNVRKIAMKFDGGGHDHACGFECYQLPFFPAPEGGTSEV